MNACMRILARSETYTLIEVHVTCSIRHICIGERAPIGHYHTKHRQARKVGETDKISSDDTRTHRLIRHTTPMHDTLPRAVAPQEYMYMY